MYKGYMDKEGYINKKGQDNKARTRLRESTPRTIHGGVAVPGTVGDIRRHVAVVAVVIAVVVIVVVVVMIIIIMVKVADTVVAVVTVEMAIVAAVVAAFVVVDVVAAFAVVLGGGPRVLDFAGQASGRGRGNALRKTLWLC